MNGLYAADGTFQAFDAESLTTELATRQNAYPFMSDAGGWFNQLPDPDPVLRKRGDDAAILADLSADDQVTTAMLSRKYRVLNCPHFAFAPGAADGSQADQAARTVYEHLVQDLERANLRSVISGILDAPFYGLTPLELIWAYAQNWWHLVDIVPRPYHWFVFDNANRPLFRGAGLASEPQTLPAGKFVFASHHASYDNPYGLRLFSRCLWPVAFKRGGIQFYAKFVERHGMPWVVGNAPAKASPEEKRDMASSLARMVQDCVAVIPAGAELQFLTAGATQSELHERFIARQDKAIAKLLMGQTLSVEMEGANSLAAAETHNSVAEGIADADKAMVADTFNEICWLYTQVNQTSAQTLAPTFVYEEPEDLLAKADLDKKLYEMGVQWLPEHFENDYGLKPTEYSLKAPESAEPDAEEAEKAMDVGKAEDAEEAAAPEFAAASKTEIVRIAQERLDTALDKLLPDALKANAEFVTQVENAIHEANSFDEIQLALADLLSTRMDMSELEDFMARSMSMAAGFGATSVLEEGVE